MKPRIQHILILVFPFILLFSCGQNTGATGVAENNMKGVEEEARRSISDEAKSYWFGGVAEISSYKLEQARYGELRDGHAVLIYVTEPFLPGKQVKADTQRPGNIQVLKLNQTKKFLTGIYPYSVMSSVFFPVSSGEHAIKLSTSVQEWCGHIYTQVNNREGGFDVDSHSYFEGEADRQFRIQDTWMEDELWTLLRLDPGQLPTGAVQIVPSLEFIRFGHTELRAYDATASLTRQGALSTYELTYPDLDRKLNIQFESSFPYVIDNWTESYKSGFGADAEIMSSRAKKIKTLKTAYWQKNGNKDVVLRDSLGL